jgi:hypothetical protein
MIYNVLAGTYVFYLKKNGFFFTKCNFVMTSNNVKKYL